MGTDGERVVKLVLAEWRPLSREVCLMKESERTFGVKEKSSACLRRPVGPALSDT